jgi:hypothetical protein
MEDSNKEYVRYLLIRLKELYGENEALKSLFRTSPNESLRQQWESALAQVLQEPVARQALDAKFDPHIEKIMRALEDQEAISALLQSPTKGLPN